jgi:ribosomal protein L11 methylase PrmA
MKEDKNILPENENNEQMVLDYLNHKLTPDEQHLFELKMDENKFMQEAVEGLEMINNKQQIMQYVAELNKNLSNQFERKKIHKHKRKLKEQDWIIISVVIILLLCILGYLVIKQIK